MQIVPMRDLKNTVEIERKCAEADIDEAFDYIANELVNPDSGALSMEESFRLSYYTMEHGTKPALLSQLGISDISDQLR